MCVFACVCVFACMHVEAKIKKNGEEDVCHCDKPAQVFSSGTLSLH